MRPDAEDAALLLDMLQSARKASEYVKESDFVQYSANPLVRDATERRIAVIGEAARGVSVQFREAHPEIPWTAIMAQRHILVHDYGTVEPRRIWEVLTVHLPALITQIEGMLPPPPKAEPE